MATADKDFELPSASINRILKSRLPEGVLASKEAKQAIGKAAGVFVLYVTTTANDFCRESRRQTISAQDVLDAMQELDFEEFIQPLKVALEAMRAETEEKKKVAKEKKAAKEAAAALAEEAKDTAAVNTVADEKGSNDPAVSSSSVPDAAAEQPPSAPTAAEQPPAEGASSDAGAPVSSSEPVATAEPAVEDAMEQG